MIVSRQPFSYRSDETVPPFRVDGVFTVMDARCAICAKGARWIAHNDRTGEFTIIPVQSRVGAALMAHYGLDPADPASWLYVEDGRAYASFDAVIRVGRRLGGIWKALLLLKILPAFVLDGLYSFVARNRIRFFGRADLCALPDTEVQKRLLS